MKSKAEEEDEEEKISFETERELSAFSHWPISRSLGQSMIFLVFLSFSLSRALADEDVLHVKQQATYGSSHLKTYWNIFLVEKWEKWCMLEKKDLPCCSFICYSPSDFWPQRCLCHLAISICSITLNEGEKTDVFDIISKALLVSFYKDISLFKHLNMCHRALGGQCFFIDHVTHFSTACCFKKKTRSTCFDDITRVCTAHMPSRHVSSCRKSRNRI